MKLYDLSLVIIIVVGICVAVGVTSVYFLGPNNEVEKVAEEVIKDETGLNIDLTPTISAEKLAAT